MTLVPISFRANSYGTLMAVRCGMLTSPWPEVAVAVWHQRNLDHVANVGAQVLGSIGSMEST